MELDWRNVCDYNDQDMVSQQFKKNDEVFRNKMEMIFQKYSHLGDPESDVCLKTMTLRTGKGTMPINSAEAECELRNLRCHVEHEQSLRVLDTSRDEHIENEHDVSAYPSANQMDTTYRSESEDSRLVEKDDGQSGKTSPLSVHSVNSSRGCFFDHSSPEEDENLERTLSSYGSTLLDVYPSILNQIRESTRRQHVTKAASAVVRRYRHQRMQSIKGKNRNSNLSSPEHSFNRFGDSAPKRFHTNPNVFRESPVNKSRPEPKASKSLRNASIVSSGCFYSPRRNDGEKCTDAESRSHWTARSRSYSKTKHEPVTVLNLSHSSDYSSPGSPSPNHRTYTVDPESTNYSDAYSSTMSRCKPTAGDRALTHVHHKGNSPLNASKSHKISTPGHQGGIGSFHPRQRATSSQLAYRGVKSISHQGDKPAMSLASSSQSNLEKEDLREHIYPPVSSSKESFTSFPSSPRSPLKHNLSSPKPLYQRSLANTYPKHVLLTHSPMVTRSPYHSLHAFSPIKENFPITLAQKRQQTLSSQQARFFDVSKMSSLQIDTEFTRLYHHFVCRGSSSSVPNSSCHICRLEREAQNPGISSSSMSALALTPVRTKLMKRRRQPEVEEPLRHKRFRESCSPHRPQTNKQGNHAMAEPSKEKHIWNRALLLQCPSPRFLRPSRGIRKATGSKLDLHRQQNSASWKPQLGCVDTSAAKSPRRISNHSDALLNPSLSRRRLLYGPPQ